MKYLTIDRTILLGVIGFFLGIVFLISYSSQSSQNPWLYYHKPEFKGQLIDFDTKQPIEGAVVETLYFRVDLISFGAGHADEIFKISESLTDKEGKFQFPSYTTWLSPFWAGENVKFIFYKPGYVNSGATDDPHRGFMNPKIQEYTWFWNKNKIIRTHGGIYELPKLESKEDRLRAMQFANIPSTGDFKNRDLLKKLLNDESLYLGFAPYP